MDEKVESEKSYHEESGTEEDIYIRDIDVDHILKYSNRDNYEIPHFYDKIQWKIGETYRIRIGNIYDPSKLWIVLKEQELTAFQKYLDNFYTNNGEAFRIPKENVKRNHYCVAFTDGGYYRGLIVNIPSFGSLANKVVVFLFDFGFISAVKVESLYYFNSTMFEVPQFAIRASLYGVEPFDTDTWISKTVNRLCELVTNKVLLCLLEVTDPKRKIVFIRIGDVGAFSQIKDIGETLINEKLSKRARLRTDKYQGSSKMVPKTKYPFLFPSFEAIETGLMPSSVYITELLKHCVTSIILFKPYYSYNGINLTDD